MARDLSSVHIDRVEAIPFSIPLHRPSRWGAAGYRTAQDHVLVRVYSTSGAVGTAEATPRPTIYGETQRSIVNIIEKYLAPALIGADATDRVRYWREFDKIQWNPTAKGALDIAVHDLLAKEAGLPLASFLGGSPSPVRISYMASLGDADGLVQEALDVRDRFGVTAFKVKAGQDPGQDIERVRRLREALGPGGFIFIDANQLYTPAVAIRTIREMLPYDLAMVEEPLPIELGRERVRVAEALPVPYLGDDSVATLADTRRELALGAIGVVGIKPPRTGIVNSLKILHTAEAFGLPCWIGSQGVSGVGTLASAHFHAAAGPERIPYPADLGNFLKQVDDLLETPVDLRDGRIHLPDRPGIGAEVSEAKLDRYRIDR